MIDVPLYDPFAELSIERTNDETFVMETLPSHSRVSAMASLSWPILPVKKKARAFMPLASCFLVAPTGFEPATSTLRGRSKRKALHNTSERFRWSEIFSYLHSLTVRNAPFGTILDRFLTDS